MHLPMLASGRPGRAIDDADNGSVSPPQPLQGFWLSGTEGSLQVGARVSRTESPGCPMLGHEGQLLLPGLVPLDRALGVAITSPGRPRHLRGVNGLFPARLGDWSDLGPSSSKPVVVYIDQFLR